MGRELPYARERAIRVAVSGWDQVDRVEVLKNNRVIHREFPVDRETSSASWSKPVLARFEYGWAPRPHCRAQLSEVCASAPSQPCGSRSDDRSQKAIVLKMRGDPSTKLTVTLDVPVKKSLGTTFRELAESSEVLYTGEFPRESAMLNRIVFSEHYETTFQVQDTGNGAQADWYYVRVVQANGQIAWSSPIWVERS